MEGEKIEIDCNKTIRTTKNSKFHISYKLYPYSDEREFEFVSCDEGLIIEQKIIYWDSADEGSTPLWIENISFENGGNYELKFLTYGKQCTIKFIVINMDRCTIG